METINQVKIFNYYSQWQLQHGRQLAPHSSKADYKLPAGRLSLQASLATCLMRCLIDTELGLLGVEVPVPTRADKMELGAYRGGRKVSKKATDGTA